MASVIEQTPFNQYTANGLTTVFPYEFELLSAADLVVRVDGVIASGSLFAVDGVGVQAGGTVTFLAAPASGADVLLSREITLARDTDYQVNGDLRADVVDRDFNRLWQALQGQGAQVGGALRLPYPEQTPELPAAAARAGYLLGFDGAGVPVLAAPAVDSATALAVLLNSSAGAANVGSRYPNGASAAVSVAARLGEQVSARFFGDKAAGTRAEYTAQVQAAADYAISIGGSLYFGQGVHEINDITTTGNLRLCGDGAGVTIIRLRGSKHRWKAVMNAADDLLIVDGITFETDAAPEGTFNVSDPNVALWAQYTLTGFDNRDGRRVFTNDVEFRGQNLAAHGWAVMMWLQNINGSIHIAPWFRGIAVNGTDDGAEAVNTISQLGVQIDGAEFPTDHRFITPTAYSLELVINATGNVEGITIDECVVVNCGMVAEWAPSPGGRPGFKFINCHANTYRGIVKLSSVQQFQIEGGEIYHNPGSASNWIGYELTNCVDGTFRGNAYFRYLAAADASTSKAIRIAGALTSNVIIDDEVFGGEYTRLDTGVELAADLNTGAVTIGKNCRWTGGLRPSGVQFRVADINNLGANAHVLGARTLLARRTAAQSAANNTNVVIDWDTLIEDTTAIWPDAAGVFTIPTGRGIKRVRVTTNVMWDANGTGIRQARILKGASVVSQTDMVAVTGVPTAVVMSVVIPVTGGDTLSVDTFQSSGGALNVSGSFTNLSIEVLN